MSKPINKQIDDLLMEGLSRNRPGMGVLFVLGVVFILIVGWAWLEGGRW